MGANWRMIGRSWAVAALLAASAFGSVAAWAGPFDLPDESSEAAFKLSGLLDLRYAYTSTQRSWLQGGTNKLRYGGRDLDNDGTGDRRGHAFAVSQASLVLDAPAAPGADLHLQLNLDADPDTGNGSAGLVEAFADLSGHAAGGAARLRVGAFIPPISWEHPEKAWSTHYTLTPSVIGSWVGEELRVFGAEASWQGHGDPALRATGAVFGGGDQTGWLLVHRGWALHDYQADLNAVLPLPTGASEQPFRELDGRAGFYGRLDLAFHKDLVKLGGGYWDNNADAAAQSLDPAGVTLAVWHTRFWDAGGKLNLGRFNAIAQVAQGRSDFAGGPEVEWKAAYLLAARHMGKGTVSARFDRFYVHRYATFLEKGYAATADLQWDLDVRRRVSLEYIYVKADPNLGIRPRAETDQLLQLNCRLKWG